MIKDNDWVTTCLGVSVGIAIIFVVGILLHGVAIQYIWKWFITDIFDVAELSLRQALGLGLVVGYLAKGNQTNKDEEKSDSVGEAILKGIIQVIATPSFVLLFGYIIHVV